jgi:tRNA threonylcarbamoyladenosine biosynthesis protein TsaE
LQISTDSTEATELLAENLASNLQGGEVIELLSDLGGGKTAFVRGLTRGLGSRDHVTSPTFKLVNTYKVENDRLKRIYHYDFYRLADAGLMANELEEALEDKKGVVVVEWGKLAEDILPSDRLKIHISKTSLTARKIKLEVLKSKSYLLKGIS